MKRDNEFLASLCESRIRNVAAPKRFRSAQNKLFGLFEKLWLKSSRRTGNAKKSLAYGNDEHELKNFYKVKSADIATKFPRMILMNTFVLGHSRRYDARRTPLITHYHTLRSASKARLKN